MALGLGKVTILIGAGILGSVLAKERQMPSVSDVLSGAFKVFLKSDPAPSSTKPKTDALMVAQIDSMKDQLRLLSNRQVTIVTSHGGGRRYGVIVLVVAVGYGYIWWKGWRLPDLTFATKRSLSDACTAIGNQLEQVYSSLAATRRDLSSRIDRTDSSLDDLSETNAATRAEVSHLRGEMDTFDVNVQSVREVVESLENRILRMQGNEDKINSKVKRLVDVAHNMEQRRSQEALQGAPSTSSRPAIEHPHILPASRALSLPSGLPMEPRSPISSGPNETQHQLNNGTAPATGLKDIQDISQPVNAVASSPRISNGNGIGNSLSEAAVGSANGGFFTRISSTSLPFLSRTRSGTQATK